LLKARTKFQAESFGKLRKDGTIEAPRVDSLTHLVMRLGRFTEAQVVSILMLIQAVFCAIAYLSVG
jgi:UDP-N-acetylglucosamine--dolichyl-phosphate N-acetylglucosaminephosphotransferase